MKGSNLLATGNQGIVFLGLLLDRVPLVVGLGLDANQGLGQLLSFLFKLPELTTSLLLLLGAELFHLVVRLNEFCLGDLDNILQLLDLLGLFLDISVRAAELVLNNAKKSEVKKERKRKRNMRNSDKEDIK